MDILAKAYDGEVSQEEKKTKDLMLNVDALKDEQRVALEDEILVQIMENLCENEEDFAWCDK